MRTSVAAALVTLVATTAGAVERHVPSQYATIKAAMTAAVNGDAVVIADGVYGGPGNTALFFGGKAITVRSANGPQGCIIHAAHAAVIFTCNAGEGPGSVIEGLTLREGNGTEGGAVRCSGASPTIRACVFEDGWAGYHSSGVGCATGSSPRIEDCVFSGGLAGVGGAVHALTGSHPKLIGCTIRGHRTDLFGAGGAGCDNTSSLTIDRCVFQNNMAMGFSPYGGAVFVSGGDATITNSVFVGNSAAYGGGAIACANGSDVSIVNCTFYGNVGGPGGALWSQNATPIVANCVMWGNAPDEISGAPQIRYSIVTGGWPGPGNLGADPMLMNPGGGDFRPAPGSPCIDSADGAAHGPAFTFDVAGAPRRVDDPATPDTGLGAPPVIDRGAHEFQPDSCYPDCNADGALTVADFGCFQTRFVAGDPYADCNNDSTLTVQDFGCFQSRFVAGCP
jgi:hypothetical protein